jgi:hypothetical protein
MSLNPFSKYGMNAVVNPSYSGKTFFVSNDAAVLTRFRGMFKPDEEGEKRVYETIDSAIGACTANRGDVILVAPGHAESVTAAAGIALDVAGVTVRGLGSGADLPTITFSTATTASFDVTANSCRVENILGVAGIDGLTKPFLVSGNDCHINIVWKDASASVEAETVVRLDTADNAYLKLEYKGFTAGNAAVRVVAVDDCDNVAIDIDGYGVVSTAWVNFVDAASTNVKVRGRLYTQGITNFSRDVVDTIGSSTWDAHLFDASAGSWVSGGSAAALAGDDVSAIATSLATLQAEVSGAAGIVSFPASAAPGNGVSLAEVIRATYDNVSGVDGSTNVLGADDADNGFASTNVVANRDGSLIERVEALMDPLGGYIPGLGYRVTKVSNLADGAGTDALFTVTGTVAITLLTGEVTTVIGGAATMKLTDTTNTVDLCAATTIDTDAVGTQYLLTGVSAQILNGTGNAPVVGSVSGITGQGPNMVIVGKTGTPITISHILDAADTGNVTWTLYYMPIVSGSTVAAAA